MQEPTLYTLTLEARIIQYLLDIISEQPIKTAGNLFGEINRQISEQNKRMEELEANKVSELKPVDKKKA